MLNFCELVSINTGTPPPPSFVIRAEWTQYGFMVIKEQEKPNDGHDTRKVQTHSYWKSYRYSMPGEHGMRHGMCCSIGEIVGIGHVNPLCKVPRALQIC